MKVLGIVGRNGAGKDSVLDFLKQQCGIAAVSSGDIVRDLARRENIKPTRNNLQQLAQKTMQMEGTDAIARRLIENIEMHAWPAVGVSGLRTADDIAVFRSHFGDNFKLAYVWVGDAERRFQRLRARGAPRDPKTLEAFVEQERSEEVQFEISAAIKQANVKIDNSGQPHELQQSIRKSPLWDWLDCGRVSHPPVDGK